MLTPFAWNNPAETPPPFQRRSILGFARSGAHAPRRRAYARLVLLPVLAAVAGGCHNHADVSYNRYATSDGNPPVLDSADAALQWCEDRIYDFDERLELWLY